MKPSENDKNLNHANDSKESFIKKYSRQFSFFRNNMKESSNDDKENEERIANSLIRKSKKNDNANLHRKELTLQQSKTSYVPKSSINKNLKKFPKLTRI